MKKNSIILSIIILVLCCGCSKTENQSTGADDTTVPETSVSKKYKNFDKNERPNWNFEYEIYDDDGNVVSYNEEAMQQVARANGNYIDMGDFDVITDDKKPLPISSMSGAYVSRIQTEINTSSTFNDPSVHFRLYNLIQYDEWVTFRKIKDDYYDGEEVYYCILEDDSLKDRLYLVFHTWQSTFACHEYLLLDAKGNEVKKDSERYFCQTERADELLKLIPKCDLPNNTQKTTSAKE